ncbi:hypothetical protein SUBVAR_06758 [Subdoligranulum variabile DSM 15176]|uniref:Uncharacterized protein n=1 Tax=Subdoligranulum variabile DSM 15176 TaxID=411471 RepID=D1PQT1_9FIRM|nr:hypothetical protein SUBVAR_06758 [Subdoligranulum variabile DSM 15176]
MRSPREPAWFFDNLHTFVQVVFCRKIRRGAQKNAVNLKKE